MNKQRLYLLLFIFFGIVATFIPWFIVHSSEGSYFIGFGLHEIGPLTSPLSYKVLWFISLFSFLILLSISLMGNKKEKIRFQKAATLISLIIMLTALFMVVFPIIDSLLPSNACLGVYLLLLSSFNIILVLNEKYIHWILLSTVCLALLLTLPFHYLSGENAAIFPKENLTFSNTFIDEGDIDNIIKRYNDASLFEKASIRNEPLVRKLMENVFLGDKNISDKNK